MARGTGVFMPRSYEDVAHTGKAVSGSAAAEQSRSTTTIALSVTELGTVSGIVTRGENSKSIGTGSPGTTTSSSRAPAKGAASSPPSNQTATGSRAGVTLRRVPWGNAQGSSITNGTSTSTIPGSSAFAVGSCPDISAAYLRQPPPPPPAPPGGISPLRRLNSISNGHACRIAALAGSAGVSGTVAGPSLSRTRSVSATGLPSVPLASTPLPAPSLRAPALSWEGSGESSHHAVPAAAASAANAWPLNPAASAAPATNILGVTASGGSFTHSSRLCGAQAAAGSGTAGQVDTLQQLLQHQQVAQRERRSCPGAYSIGDPQTTCMSAAQLRAAASATTTAGVPAAGQIPGPWQLGPGPLDPDLSSSFHSCPLPPVLSIPSAGWLDNGCGADGNSPTGHSSSSMLAAAGSWAGTGLTGLQFAAGDACSLQDGLFTSTPADGGMVLGSSLPNSVFTSLPLSALADQQRQAQPQQQQHLDLAADALAGTSPITSTMAVLSQQLAALRAGSAGTLPAVPPPARPTCLRHSQSGPLRGLARGPQLSGPVNAFDGSLLSPAYDDTFATPGLDLAQQLQAANDALGFGGAGAGGGGGGGSPAVPISIPNALSKNRLVVSAANEQAADMLSGTSVPHDSSDAGRAVVVAQMKLQQLMAVEQIQKQLQDEVMRLLPLI